MKVRAVAGPHRHARRDRHGSRSNARQGGAVSSAWNGCGQTSAVLGGPGFHRVAVDQGPEFEEAEGLHLLQLAGPLAGARPRFQERKKGEGVRAGSSLGSFDLLMGAEHASADAQAQASRHAIGWPPSGRVDEQQRGGHTPTIEARIAGDC